MKPLYTLAFPVLGAEAVRFIESFRQQHDPRAPAVAAHFTMVFRRTDIDEAEYRRHVMALSHSAGPVSFVLRYAMLGTDDEAERGYVFLVPDEGYSGLSLLHDTLYRGILAPHLRLDIPYVPHITIGAAADRTEAKRLCDELNGRTLEFAGTVEALTVATLDGGWVHALEAFPLRGRCGP